MSTTSIRLTDELKSRRLTRGLGRAGRHEARTISFLEAIAEKADAGRAPCRLPCRGGSALWRNF